MRISQRQTYDYDDDFRLSCWTSVTTADNSPTQISPLFAYDQSTRSNVTPGIKYFLDKWKIRINEEGSRRLEKREGA